MASRNPHPPDPALLGLEHALDTDEMHAILARVTEPHHAGAYEAEILSHKVGARCTIRYSPVGRSASRRDAGVVIGKLYRSRRRAARMYRRQLEVGSRAFSSRSRTRLPAVLHFEEELGLVLQAHVDGVDLRDFFSDDAGVAPLEVAGHWLARLHASDPPPEIKTMSSGGRLERMRGWTGRIVAHLPPAEGRRLVAGLERAAPILERAARRTPPVLIHKDFYYANLLWDGLRIWGLDLDELSLGDASFDVGHFLAHLERHAWRTGLALETAAVAGRRFLEAYEEDAGAGHRPVTPFYKGYTFVKLAATEVERKRPDWRVAARALATKGYREIELFLSSADRLHVR